MSSQLIKGSGNHVEASGEAPQSLSSTLENHGRHSDRHDQYEDLERPRDRGLDQQLDSEDSIPTLGLKYLGYRELREGQTDEESFLEAYGFPLGKSIFSFRFDVSN